MTLNTFDLERRMQPVMDAEYTKRGYTICRDGACKKYDVILTKGDRAITVEEKFLQVYKPYDQMLVEIIQDMKSGGLGWMYYCEADFLIWVYGENEEPYGILEYWIIRWNRLKEYLLKSFDTNGWRSLSIVPENYGITVNAPVRFCDIGDFAERVTP